MQIVAIAANIAETQVDTTRESSLILHLAVL